MELSRKTPIDKVLICSLNPYFLEKGNLWFEKNLEKILEARKTQTFFEDNILFLEKNQNYNFSQFLRKLDELGYEKVYQISEPGEFSQRGGIVDVFPINSECAFRIEFFGNQVATTEQLPIQIENEKEAKEKLKKKLKYQKVYSQLGNLKSGDFLVHLDHGVGIYQKRVKIQNQEYYQLEYAARDTLYVPLGLERKLSRYVGFVTPKISRLASSLWQRTKKQVKEEVIKLAKELLEIYAKREIAKRSPYLPRSNNEVVLRGLSDDEIDSYLEGTFPYEETPDQIQVLEDIKNDLKKEIPMDRLVCGDVGFGKTEIALRTAVKAVKSGFQVAMICPTTILAHQHFQNFKERLQNLPFKIELLSRLQFKKEQKKIIENLKSGKIDILIGTHRILSNDVEFQNVGLLIIDDEQRFGVKQKEKLKKIKTSLDVLSLSATPIPRTLYLALSSLKTISLIQTPPFGRLPIKTFILPFSEKIIKKAIENEVSRGGQVYYLHNRVETIETAKNFLECLNLQFKHKPKFGIAHGRLKEKELVKVMDNFQNRKIDILVATTIIENGLDLPNVNTLIVADGTKLGLAEAYQIRGRVGRSHIQAFGYFLYPPKFSKEKFRRASGQKISEKVYPVRKSSISNGAKMRLDALKEAEELGSGYKIALKDLEIRGAGNILGKEQSGNINQVGLNLYCQMLSEAIEKLRIARPVP